MQSSQNIRIAISQAISLLAGKIHYFHKADNALHSLTWEATITS
jgi:hypothetical protein